MAVRGLGRLKDSDILLLKEGLTLVGCLLFLGSILSPFCSGTVRLSGAEEDNWYASYWSFKVKLTPGWLIRKYREPMELWFYQNEFYTHINNPAYSWSLVFVFAGQLLTLATGIASFLTRKTWFAPITFASSSSVLVLMTCAKLQTMNPEFIAFESGYWLTLLSLLLFLHAFLLTPFSRK